MNLKITNILSTDGNYSRVRLAKETFDCLKPGTDNSMAFKELGWTDTVNGDLVRIYDFDGKELRTHWNPITKSSFIVKNEVAQECLVKDARPKIELPYNISTFKKATA